MKSYSEDELDLYLDGELSAEQERELEHYLTQDAQARQYVEGWSGLRRSIQNSVEPEVSERFLDDVMSRLGLAEEEQRETDLPGALGWSATLRTWFFPCVQLVGSFLILFYAQSRETTATIDTDMVLLAGLQGEVVQQDYSPLPFDMSTALGFSTEGL